MEVPQVGTKRFASHLSQPADACCAHDAREQVRVVDELRNDTLGALGVGKLLSHIDDFSRAQAARYALAAGLALIKLATCDRLIEQICGLAVNDDPGSEHESDLARRIDIKR